jgi:hypothetical protein
MVGLARGAQAANPPNVLFLLTDDQSYASLSSTANSFMKTHHIDRIGRDSASGRWAMAIACSPDITT